MGRPKVYYANDNFFSTWSHDMAYCLGFITADGHVWKDRPYLTIGISNKDKYILEYIKDCISPTSLVRENKTKNQVQINVHSIGIWTDLKKYNVTNDKTFKLKIDFDIPDKYWGDYLRGFFDGDGSIWETTFRKQHKKYFYSNFACASRPMLEYIQKRLGFGTIRVVRGKYFELKFSQSDSLKLYEIMYKNPQCFKLKRKYDRFKKIDIIYKFWTQEEDDILKSNINLMPKSLKKLLPNRTISSIQSRKSNLLCKLKK